MLQSVAVMLAFSALAHGIHPRGGEEPERSLQQRQAVTTLLLAFTPSTSPLGISQHSDLAAGRHSEVHALRYVQEKIGKNAVRRRTSLIAKDLELTESDRTRLAEARAVLRKPRFLPWTDARKWARTTHLETEEDWKEWLSNGEKKVPLIPSKPDEVYADSGWEGWHDFLNEPVDSDGAGLMYEDAESVSKRKPRFLPWIDARKWARTTHMETEEDWKEWIHNGEKKVPSIPSKPDEVYADSGWKGWHDFLKEPADQ